MDAAYQMEIWQFTKSGEIDIMENVGYLPDSVYGSVHTNAFNHSMSTNKTGGVLRKNLRIRSMCMPLNGAKGNKVFCR